MVYFKVIHCGFLYFCLVCCLLISSSTSHFETALGMVRPFPEGSLEGQVAQNMRLGARACSKYLQDYSFLISFASLRWTTFWGVITCYDCAFFVKLLLWKHVFLRNSRFNFFFNCNKGVSV